MCFERIYCPKCGNILEPKGAVPGMNTLTKFACKKGHVFRVDQSGEVFEPKGSSNEPTGLTTEDLVRGEQNENENREEDR